LHAQFGTIGDVFRIAKQVFNAPLVVSFRGFDYSTWPKSQGRDVYRHLFQEMDGATVNTDFSRLRLRELGCPADKIHKIPSAVDVESIPFKERAIEEDGFVRVLTVGRLSEGKGIQYAIEAVVELAQSFPRLKYDIIGDGPQRGSLQQLISSSNADSFIKLHGPQAYGSVQDFMGHAHIFLLTSVTTPSGEEESLGNVLVEAQASGLPVIATRHNGFPETIRENESGLLVEERNVSDLVRKLRYLIQANSEWPSMGRRGRSHVENRYDMNMVIPRLVDLYDNVSRDYRSKGGRYI
jgi:colanic acid/amylovoran biosynthesis glycosyltransferase